MRSLTGATIQRHRSTSSETVVLVTGMGVGDVGEGRRIEARLFDSLSLARRRMGQKTHSHAGEYLLVSGVRR